jgi:hypothetical protein
MTRVPVIVLVCLALVLGGCSALSPGTTSTDFGETPGDTATERASSPDMARPATTTGAQVDSSTESTTQTTVTTGPATNTVTTPASNCRNELGVSAASAGSNLTVERLGIKNGTLTQLRPLFLSHYRSLDETGYVGRMWVNLTSGSTGSSVERNNFTVRQAPDGYPARVRRNVTGYSNSTFAGYWLRDTWENRSVEFTRSSRPGRRDIYFRWSVRPSKLNGQLADRLLTYFEWGEHDVASVESTAAGCRVTLELARLNRTFERRSNVTGYSGTAVVDGEGRIRSIDATFDFGADDDNTIGPESRRRNVSWDLHRVGNVTVDRPTWIDAAVEFTRNQSTPGRTPSSRPS